MIISIFSFLLLPIISLLFVILFYFVDKKNSWFYSILMGIGIGVICYYFIPPISYDLYRHHMIVENFFGQNIQYYFKIMGQVDLENFPLFICFIISKFNNVNLLQFFIVSMGYSILFYLLNDYRIRSQTPFLSFLAIFLFSVFGFNALYFISGLWFYIALLIFCLAFYFDYEKKFSKALCYLLYVVSGFMHNAILFLLIILIVYKFFKSKLNFKSIFITLLIFVTPVLLLNFLTSIVNFNFLNNVQRMYLSYFSQNEIMKKFYSGTIFFIEITKLIITLIAVFIQKKRKIINDVNGFVILLSICTIFMMFRSIVMIRFIMAVQFIGIIAMMDSLKTVSKNKFWYLLIIYFLAAIYILYFYKVFRYENFKGIQDALFKNIFSILFGK